MTIIYPHIKKDTGCAENTTHRPLCRSFPGADPGGFGSFDRYDVYKKMQAQDLLLEDRSSGGNKLIMHPLEKDKDF